MIKIFVILIIVFSTTSKVLKIFVIDLFRLTNESVNFPIVPIIDKARASQSCRFITMGFATRLKTSICCSVELYSWLGENYINLNKWNYKWKVYNYSVVIQYTLARFRHAIRIRQIVMPKIIYHLRQSGCPIVGTMVLGDLALSIASANSNRFFDDASDVTPIPGTSLTACWKV